jgi:predicted methyltransferase
MTAPAPNTRRRLVYAAIGAVVLLLGALYGPTAAFHFLPFSSTGEADRLAALLEIAPGRVVAEIGAGAGAMTVEMARRVGPGGRVYSTEIDAGRRAAIAAHVADEALANVTVVEAGEAATNLPDACCDAIFMRNVYHHIGDARAFNVSVRRAIRDGGWFAVIDFEPGAFFHLPGRPTEGSAERTGHGVMRARLIAEVTAAGFDVEREVPDWGGRMFLVLFRARPAGAGPASR